MAVLESSTLIVEHHVRARHASTREAITHLGATWSGVPPIGRVIRVVGADVVVAADDRFAAPTTAPRIRLIVTDPRLALRLDEPSVEVVLNQADIVVDFPATPMTVEVELVRRNGDPSTSKVVEARASGGAREALPELPASAGTYRSALRVWTAAFHSFDLLVDGTFVRRVGIDFARLETRLTVVDPT